MNNQRQMIVYVKSVIDTLTYCPVFAPPQRISLEFVDIDQDQLTELRQPLQVQSHLEMPRILVQLGHIQRT